MKFLFYVGMAVLFGGTLALVAVWWRHRRVIPPDAAALLAEPPRGRLRRFRDGLSGLANSLATTAVPAPNINGLGTFVAVVLNVVIGAAVLGIIGLIVLVGFGEFAEFLRGTTLTPDAQIVVEVGVAIIALAAIVAVVIMMLRSGPFVWRMNLVRVLAVVLLVAVVVAVRPISAVRAFGSGFSWWGGEKSEHAGTTLEAIIPAPASLTADEVAMRAQETIDAYRFYLNTYGVQGILDIIARVRDPRWQPFVQSSARSAGFDPARIEAVIATESAGRPDATSNTNQSESLRARGLMQIIDGNARTYGRACGITRVGSHGDSYIPEKNICAGVAYLQALVAKYGDWELAFTGYNWGMGNLDTKGVANFTPTSEHPRVTFWGLLAQDILVNKLHPGETAQYVPRVLAWEYILKYYDAHERLPPWDGHPIDMAGALLATRSPVFTGGGGGAGGGSVVVIEDGDSDVPEPPQSNVWYTAKAGDSFGGVVEFLLHENTQAVVELNSDIAENGLRLQPGARLRLPESRYAFHHASGSETFRDIAIRYRMTTAELLRWSGTWSDEQVRRAGRRDCPLAGCDDERIVASAGTQFLVRK